LSSSAPAGFVPQAQRLLQEVLQSLRGLTPVPLEITSVEPFDGTEEQRVAIRALGLPVDPDVPRPQEVSVTGRAGGEEFQFFLLDRDTPDVRAATCANTMADAVQEALGPLPFPTCPGHFHPAVVEHRAPRVYWCCPTARGTALVAIADSTDSP